SGGTPEINASLLLPDGRILLGGSLTSVSGLSRSHIALINSGGSVDGSFLPSIDGAVLSLARQADGGILVGGKFNTVNGIEKHKLARLSSSGELENDLQSLFRDASDNV